MRSGLQATARPESASRFCSPDIRRGNNFVFVKIPACGRHGLPFRFVHAIRPPDPAKDVAAGFSRIDAPCNAPFRLLVSVGLGAVEGLHGAKVADRLALAIASSISRL